MPINPFPGARPSVTDTLMPGNWPSHRMFSGGHSTHRNGLGSLLKCQIPALVLQVYEHLPEL